MCEIREIGRKVEGKVQSVRVEFRNCAQAEKVLENRKKVEHFETV